MTATPALPLSVSTAAQAKTRKRPRNVPATTTLAPATRVPAQADWPNYLAALARRGQLSAVFHPDQVARWERGTSRGRPYATEMIVALCLLHAAT